MTVSAKNPPNLATHGVLCDKASRHAPNLERKASMQQQRTSLPVGAHALAAAQARAHASIALAAIGSVASSPESGLASLVNGALAMELYFKALMIAGRGGNVTSGHDLVKLLEQFPPFLRHSFASQYERHPSARKAEIQLVALRLSAEAPATPGQMEYKESYASFDSAIKSFAHVFVKTRYFFEGLATPDWAVFSFPRDAMEGVLHAQEATYLAFVSGEFSNKI